MLPGLIGPFAAVAGYNIYEFAKHRKSEKGHGSINQHIEMVSKDVEKKAGEVIEKSEHSAEEKGFLHSAKNVAVYGAKNMAVAMAATIAMIPVTKFFGRRVEFAADKFAANLVGGEYVASALQKMDKVATEVMDRNNIPKFLQTLNKAMDYHPSVASRVKNLGV